MATVTVAGAKNRFSDLLRRAEYGGANGSSSNARQTGGCHRVD
jgi:hypothetical protein